VCMSEQREHETKAEEARGEVKREKRADIKALLAVIPPADALLKKREARKSAQERRIRLRYGEVERDQVAVSEKLAKELELKEQAYITVAGKKRFLLKVVIKEGLSENVALVNGELMRENGIADNSIATIKSA